MDELRGRLEAKTDEFEMLEKEYKKLQDKHRETMNNEYALQTAKEHLEASMLMMQQDVQRLQGDYEDKMLRFNRERSELFSKVAELTKAYERTKDELIIQKSKGKGYKEKLRLANQAMKTLTNKVMQYESERVQFIAPQVH
jgi:chromosome segregation ATPase